MGKRAGLDGLLVLGWLRLASWGGLKVEGLKVGRLMAASC